MGSASALVRGGAYGRGPGSDVCRPPDDRERRSAAGVLLGRCRIVRPLDPLGLLRRRDPALPEPAHPFPEGPGERGANRVPPGPVPETPGDRGGSRIPPGPPVRPAARWRYRSNSR